MNYISTRGNSASISTAEAIKQGLANDGGLLVPEIMPELTMDQIVAMAGQSYMGRALTILSLFLTDYSRGELLNAIEEAYSDVCFQPSPAPLVQLNKYNEREFILNYGMDRQLLLRILPCSFCRT